MKKKENKAKKSNNAPILERERDNNEHYGQQRKRKEREEINQKADSMGFFTKLGMESGKYIRSEFDTKLKLDLIDKILDKSKKLQFELKSNYKIRKHQFIAVFTYF